MAFRREAVILWFAFRNPATPWHLKAASLVTGLYLVSPIDLIPFTVPLFGVIDDLVLVPLAVGFIARRLPGGVEAEAGRKADAWILRWFKRPLLAAAIIVALLVVVWLGLLYFLYRFILG